MNRLALIWCQMLRFAYAFALAIPCVLAGCGGGEDDMSVVQAEASLEQQNVIVMPSVMRLVPSLGPQ